MSLITTIPASDTVAEIQAAAAPFRRTRRAPAFRPEIVRSLRMHPLVAIAVFLTVLAVALFYAMSLQPMYQAESRIYIEPSVSSPLSDANSNGLFDSVRYDSYLQQQMQTATRVDILKTAIDSLPAGTWALPGETSEAAAHRLGAALKVARVTTSYQMSIALTGRDAKKTTQIVNAVTTAYLDAGRLDELSHSTSRAQILSEERDRITRELAAARTEQTSLGTALGVASPGTAVANPYDDQLTVLRGELIGARQAHDLAAAQLTSVAGNNATAAPGLDALATEMAASDTGLASLKSSVNQRREVLAGQMAGLTPANPAYKLDQDELADLNKVLTGTQTQLRDQAARRLEDKLRAELQRTGDMESRLNGEVARGTAAATSAAPKLQRSQELTANIARLTARFGTIDDALRTLELETHGMPMAHLSLAAAVPMTPEPSRRKLVLLAALPLSLMAALFAATLLHRRERRIFIAHDMEDLLGFTPIAVLPSRADVSAAVLEEYVLRLAGGIENAYRSRGARAFVLTPVSAGTSLDFLTELLSSKLMALGLEVAIVRAADLLDGAVSTRALATNGQHEGRMASALDRLKASYDLIFIAAPALLTSAEAEYVARAADATILVAECGATLKEELVEAANLLERLQVAGVGTVLDELKLRYADRAFRNAVSSVESRLRTVESPRNTVSMPPRGSSTNAAQIADPGYTDSVAHTQPAAPFEPQAVTAYEPVAPSTVGAEAVHEPLVAAYPAAPNPAEPNPVAPELRTEAVAHPQQSEEAVRHTVYAPYVAPAESIAAAETHAPAASPAAEETHDTVPRWQPIDLAAAHEALPSVSGASFGSHAGELAQPVWPAAQSHMEPSKTVQAYERELLSARGTSVFLTQRAAADRGIERLEPLGTQDALAPAAEMLAASFGTLPMEIEPTPADVLYPQGTTSEEAESIRIARANREALANGKPLGPVQEPVKMDEIRRLLNPVKAETTIETRNGKDMIGARAVTEAAHQTRLEGWTPDGDAGMSAKKNWFQKLFQRDEEPGFSIVRSTADDEDHGETEYTSPHPNSMYDLPMRRPTVGAGESAVAVSEPPVALAAPYFPTNAHFRDETSPADQPVFAEASQSNNFRPVARMVSLLTPVAEPAAVPTAPPPPATAMVHEGSLEPVSNFAAQAPAVKSAAPVVAELATLPVPTARRPKSFFQLAQARRRPAVATLVAERAIAVAATPSMLQDEPASKAAEESAIETALAHRAEPMIATAPEPAVVEAVEFAERIEDAPAAVVEEPASKAAVAATAPVDVLQPRRDPEIVTVEDEPSTQVGYRAFEPVRRSPAEWPVRTAPLREYAARPQVSEPRFAEPVTEHIDEPRLQTRPESRPSSLDPALSRRWGLLSRYQQTDRPQGDANEDTRRGGE